MAGRLDKLVIVKPQTIYTNFKSPFFFFFQLSRQKNWRQLYYGTIVTSVQNSRMCILQQNSILQKQNKHVPCQTRWLIFGSKFDTLWPSEIALNGKNIHTTVRTHTWTLTKNCMMPKIFQQSKSWRRMLWLTNGHDLIKKKKKKNSKFDFQNFLEPQEREWCQRFVCRLALGADESHTWSYSLWLSAI